MNQVELNQHQTDLSNSVTALNKLEASASDSVAAGTEKVDFTAKLTTARDAINSLSVHLYRVKPV